MKPTTRGSPEFGLCINNTGYPASLEIGKRYDVVPDEVAAKRGYVRVVDESGEDYGYSADRFILSRRTEVISK